MAWFGKKGPIEGEVRAYQFGQQAGEEMATAFQLYQEQRFGPVHDRYLGVLRDALQLALKGEDKPPLLMCRAHVQVFEKQVGELKSQMFDDTKSAMSDWFERARTFGVLDEVETGVRQSIDLFCKNLLNEGGAVIEQYIPVVQDADEAWQGKYPERAAHYYSRK